MDKEDNSDDNMLGASPELVAYRLFLDIMKNERRPLTRSRDATPKLNRQFILKTYATCLEAARGQRPLKGPRVADKVTWRSAGSSSATKG